jgi:hypothetical protein
LLKDWQAKVLPLALSMLVVLVPPIGHVNRCVAQSSDSRWTLHIAASIIQERSVDLDEYQDAIPADDYRTDSNGVAEG